MKRQIQLHTAAGKTIHKIVEGSHDLAIVYTDDTFSLLHPSNGYDGCDADINDADDYFKGWGSFYIDTADMIAAGVLTQEEADALSAARDKEYAERQARHDRQIYEKLKAKFEP